MSADATTTSASISTPVALMSRPKQARVCLIRPNVVIFPKSLSWYGPVPPIGLAYIAATLRDAGHHVDVIDSAGAAIEQYEDFETPVGTLRRVGLSVPEIVDRIDPATDVVGITNMFVHEWPHIRELAERVRERLPHVTIIVGGDNATAFWPWMFEETDAIDHCVLGEGEATTLELVGRVADGESVTGLQGVATRGVGEERASDTGLSARRTKQLSEVPRPAWDLFPLDEYFRYADFFGVNRGRSLPILATRGCPYQCSFCSSPQMWTTRYVVREPEDVADEIADYVERYGLRNVNFADLTAITKRKWTLRFCDALEARVPGITWQLPVGTRAEALDREVLQRLHDTGCRNVAYAPEAGGDRMLEIYDKRVSIPHILESLGHAHDVGLVTKVNIIIGHPEERWSDVWKSLVFLVKAARAGADDAAVMMFGPYPGSADFHKLVDTGKVTIDDTYNYVALSWASSVHASYNDRMSARQLRATQLALLLTFYGSGLLLHPSRVITYLKAQVTGKERSALDALVRTKVRGFRALSPKASRESRRYAGATRESARKEPTRWGTS
jgi:radical SAM superfamily enzyme YgiQ (UPF0313 family)